MSADTDGLRNLAAAVALMPAAAEQAARRAVNDAARFGRALAARRITTDDNITKGYLDSNNRLSITKFASGNDLEAIITGRDRATSLARFSKTTVTFGKQKGVVVSVLRQNTKLMKQAFFMRLKRGQSLDPQNNNVGLAIRLKKGQKLQGSVGALDLGKGLYLLYGPSINQIFEGVSEDIVDEVGSKMEDEFIRQYELLTK